MNKRLEQFLAAENMSQTQFAETINVARASISHLLAGRNNPGYDFIKSVMQHYPNLNMDWLILGTDKMYKEQQPSQPQQNIQQSQPGSLFPGEIKEEPVKTEPESAAAAVQDKERENIAATNKTTASYTQQEVRIKQRVVSKIIVFFDDGSFQELGRSITQSAKH